MQWLKWKIKDEGTVGTYTFGSPAGGREPLTLY